jgi:hypothetical protein
MGNTADAVFWISLAGLLVLLALEFRKSPNVQKLIFYVVALAVCGGIYFFVFQSSPHLSGKGEQQPNQTGFVVVLYFCMLLGMGSHYFYTLFGQPKSESTAFDIRGFLAPMFASPLVFIPLLAAFQNAEVDLTNLTLPKFMVFFVAFENGFFWKEVVDNRRKAQEKRQEEK